MSNFSSVIVYSITFVSLYIQVFFIIIFLEHRAQIKRDEGKNEPVRFPSVTVIVPCWNEERTIYKTIRSLLALEYPKNKLHITIVDDGSTDNTWQIIQKFKKYSNVEVFHKENGGKYTALNLGIENATTQIVGCLDADSFVDSKALSRLIAYFDNPKVMAVAPTIIVHKPKNVIELAQRVEYYIAVFVKKTLGCIGGIHVTPGPFSFYRREIFQKIGLFRPAHNTEDQEIAYRMQANHMYIAHCHNAYVYTIAPNTVKKLYKQRLRWISGFISNTIDYKHLLFKGKYGAFSWFTIPAGVVGIIIVIYLFGFTLYEIGAWIYHLSVGIGAVGLQFLIPHHGFDLFFVNTKSVILLTIFIYLLVGFTLVIGKYLTESKPKFSFDIVYYLLIYTFVAPAWIFKAVYNVATAQKPSWR